MVNNKTLFFIVGAQKAGTTSLHKYLSAHPDIHMPIEKEVPFFDRAAINRPSWDEYVSKYLTPKNGQMIAGTATPQYMCDYRIPARIAEYAPGAKIIIVLRDPVERAASHYKMMVSRNLETRSFEDAINEQLVPEQLHKEREKTYEEIIEYGENTAYVRRGEYKHFIDLYRHYFPGSVLIICSDSLKNNRKKTIEDVLRFLGARESIIPATLSNVYHKSEAGFPDKAKRWIVQSKPTRFLAKLFIKESIRKRILHRHFAYLSHNIKAIHLSEKSYYRLVMHYQNTNAGLGDCMDSWFQRPRSQDGSYVL